MEYLLEAIFDELKQYSIEPIDNYEKFMMLKEDDLVLSYDTNWRIMCIGILTDIHKNFKYSSNTVKCYKIQTNLNLHKIITIIWSIFDNNYLVNSNDFEQINNYLLVNYDNVKINIFIIRSVGEYKSLSKLKYYPNSQTKDYELIIADKICQFGYVDILYKL